MDVHDPIRTFGPQFHPARAEKAEGARVQAETEPSETVAPSPGLSIGHVSSATMKKAYHLPSQVDEGSVKHLAYLAASQTLGEITRG